MQSPANKKQKTTTVPENLALNKFVNDLKQITQNYKQKKPFSHLLLEKIFEEEFLKKVKEDLREEVWNLKDNDLFRFHQTNDLNYCTKSSIVSLREALYSQTFRDFLQSITGIYLNDQSDISGSKYLQGNTLLCHDDELSGRRIAYILYLVPEDWSEEDGGTLDLFKVDPDGQPIAIEESIVPVWNSLIFFEVTPYSYHQVSEVLSSKERLSVGGWFYGNPIERPTKYIEPKLERTAVESITYPEPLSSWINPKYLSPETEDSILQHFEKNGSVELLDFLVENRYTQLLESLTEQNWFLIGPANRRHYRTLGRFKKVSDTDNYGSGIVEDFCRFLRSYEFSEFLQRLLSIVPHESFVEVRNFSGGCYTLVHDNQDQHNEEGLDVVFHLMDESLSEEQGGFHLYTDGDEELIRIIPVPNSLTIVLRDEGCMRFVKYITQEYTGNYYDFAMVTWEDSESKLDHNDEVEETDQNEKEAVGEDEGPEQCVDEENVGSDDHRD